MNTLLRIAFAGLLILTGFNSFSQEMKKYICNGEGKAQGLKFSINYPSNWTITDGERPHIIKTFEFENNVGYISMVVYIKKLEIARTKDEINMLFQKDRITSNPELNISKVIEFNNEAQIEDVRCMYMTYYSKKKVFDKEVNSIVKNHYIYFDKFLIQVNFFIISKDQKYETMLQIFNKNNPLFKEMMYSMAINSRWE